MTDLEKEMLGVIVDFIEYSEQPPEKDCQCANSPPCYDCVEYSMIREVFERAKEVVAKAQGTEEELCIDEGCPHYGTPHVCVSGSAPKVVPPEFTCRFCGRPSYLDPKDQEPPADYCHDSDHGVPPCE